MQECKRNTIEKFKRVGDSCLLGRLPFGDFDSLFAVFTCEKCFFNATRILFGAWCFQVMLPLKVEDVQDSLLNCKSLTLHVPIREFSFPAIANMLATTPNLEKLVIKFELSAWDASWYNSNLDSNNVDPESYWHIKKKF
ncbi:hypothetical protein NL676_008688, partial [Syzygium grande]